jgi:hypothetical protein
MSRDPKDPHLFELLSHTIKTALDYVHLADTGRTHIGTHSNWPELSWYDSGLPNITTISDGPKDYSEVVRPSFHAMFYALAAKSEQIPKFSKESSFVALLEYVETDPRLNTYLMLDRGANWGESRLLGIVGEILDRYVHIGNAEELLLDELLSVYLPIERFLLDEALPATTAVPILFVNFETSSFRLNDSVSIEQMSDDWHLARGWHGPWKFSHDSSVESAATHALCISNRTIENHSWLDLHNAVSQHDLERIDRFFAAIRITTGYETGYAQLLTIPLGWASGYTADLMPIETLSVNNYPPTSERGAWRDEAPMVSLSDAENIKRIFKGLEQTIGTGHERRVRLAMHRLNLSSMRTTEEDEVIDAVIAMEALLSDDNQEMTHKVAMRMATLYKLIDISRTEQIFKETKQIYRFRSKIVHGDADLYKFREIDRSGERISTVDAAIEHLRTAFSILIQNPALLEPRNIDNYLLTNTFEAFPPPDSI